LSKSTFPRRDRNVPSTVRKGNGIASRLRQPLAQEEHAVGVGSSSLTNKGERRSSGTVEACNLLVERGEERTGEEAVGKDLRRKSAMSTTSTSDKKSLTREVRSRASETGGKSFVLEEKGGSTSILSKKEKQAPSGERRRLSSSEKGRNLIQGGRLVSRKKRSDASKAQEEANRRLS